MGAVHIWWRILLFVYKNNVTAQKYHLYYKKDLEQKPELEFISLLLQIFVLIKHKAIFNKPLEWLVVGKVKPNPFNSDPKTCLNSLKVPTQSKLSWGR